MPFIPHTESDVREMLAAIGAPSIEALFGEIPDELRCGRLQHVPDALSEMEVSRLMRARAAQDAVGLNFIGAGAYEHHIPAAVWELTTRGEFYSAYTPYQAEASQGTLQLLYEYQSNMCSLTGLEVSNASLYDGASALAEAVLMAERASPAPKRRVLVPRSLNPVYRQVLRALIEAQNIEIVELPLREGRLHPADLDASGATAVVVPQPNYFGLYEEVDALTDAAQAAGAMVIAVVNPLSLALLKPPGQWGARGADLCCGDGQPFGAPLSSGGPYFGFLTAKQSYVRQMPGRIVGRTVDLDGKPGYTLTLQAREQHIRRSKATSNICTNQGLLVTAATIHLALLGAEGLARVASHCVRNTQRLVERLCALPGVRPVHAGPYFHEAALQLPRPVQPVLEALAARGILGGLSLAPHYPELGEALLVCATETKTDEDLARYAQVLGEILSG
ncbi:MAG TPA: aminomethyl-transferring glycine dehydrogenase subunit GcvPA [Nevskiaceae bacterium]|nr:aminomethyl-transferring glycine dehydrogenase subunit GcvPA [Nevskiaceae bacterium]